MKGLDNAALCPECGAAAGSRRPISHVNRVAASALASSLCSWLALIALCAGLNLRIGLTAWVLLGGLTFALTWRASQFARESGSHRQLFPLIWISELLALVPIGLIVLGLLLLLIAALF